MQSRSANNAQGIDVSAYQGDIHWPQVAQSGISFAFIKATEGSSLVDNQFVTNYAAAKAAGIIRGAYCFAHPGTGSAVEQANHFVDVVDAAGGFDELPPVLDIEDTGGLNNQDLVNWVRAWLSQVGSRTGKQPIIYTSPNFASAHLPSTLSLFPLWVASYGVSEPQNASGWTKWTFWQYSDTGTVPGVPTPVDLDVYTGTVEDLKNAFHPNITDTSMLVFVEKQPFQAIAVDDATYVVWTALVTLQTPHTYKGNGLMNINGTDVQGVVYNGDTYVPWQSLAPNVKAEKVWHFSK